MTALLRPLLAALLLAAPLAAEPLRIGTESDYFPYIYRDDSGGLAGADVAVMSEVCARGAFDCLWVERPFADLFDDLAAGDFAVAIGGIGPSPAREMLVDFTRPYRTIDGPRNFFLGLDEDLMPENVRVGVAVGTVQADHLAEGGYDFYPFASNAEALAALRAGRVEAIYVGAGYLGDAGIADDPRIVPLGYIERPASSISIAVRKQTPALRARLDEILAQMEADGTLRRILDRHFPDPANPEI